MRGLMTRMRLSGSPKRYRCQNPADVERHLGGRRDDQPVIFVPICERYPRLQGTWLSSGSLP